MDECFLEFLDEPKRYEMSDLRGEYPNLLIIKAFTKIFSMPGLRLGYAISSNQDILEEMSWKLQQWNVSASWHRWREWQHLKSQKNISDRQENMYLVSGSI